MKVNYTLTLADYKAAQQLHIRQKISRRISQYFWYVGVPVVAVLWLLVFILGDFWETTDLGSPYRWILSILLWFSIFLPLMRFINIRRCFKMLSQQLNKDRIVSIEINDECVLSAIPGVSEGKFFWSAIQNFAQDEKVTLLYVAEKKFLYIPTNAFSPTERTELNELVSRNMVRKEK
jgi:hypothetical protein